MKDKEKFKLDVAKVTDDLQVVKLEIVKVITDAIQSMSTDECNTLDGIILSERLQIKTIHKHTGILEMWDYSEGLGENAVVNIGLYDLIMSELMVLMKTIEMKLMFQF
jgi:hypothetical protein